MKKILLLFALCLSFISVFAQTNDTTKYVWYRYAYGNKLARYWANENLKVGPSFGTSVSMFQLTNNGTQPFMTIGPKNYSNGNVAWVNGQLVDSNVTSNPQKILGARWNRQTIMGANGVTLSFRYGGSLGWQIALKDSTVLSNQNNDGTSASILGMEFDKVSGQTTRSVVQSGAATYDHSSATLIQTGLVGGSSSNNFKLRGYYAGAVAYPYTNNASLTDSMDAYTAFVAGGGAYPNGIKIGRWTSFLSTAGGGLGENIDHYYTFYGPNGSAIKVGHFWQEGDMRIGGTILTDDTARYGAKVDIDGPIVIQDGTQAAGNILQSDANGKSSWVTPASIGAGGVTNVATGYGLTGGPITATGTITADTTNQLASKLRLYKVADSLGAAIAAKGTGTVTNVATGYGLSGGAITTTGTLLADTTNQLASKLRLYKVRDSLANTALFKAGATTNYVPYYDGTGLTWLGNTSTVNKFLRFTASAATPVLDTLINTDATGAVDGYIATYNSGGVNFQQFDETPWFVRQDRYMGGTAIAMSGDPASASGTLTLTDNRCYLGSVLIGKDQTATGVEFFIKTNGSYTADQTNSFALYSINTSTGLLTKVAETANSGTLYTAGANTWVKIAFASTVALTKGTYFGSFLWNASATTTAPTLKAQSWGNTNEALLDLAIPGTLWQGAVFTQNTQPSTISAGSFVQSSSAGVWFMLY